MHPGRPLGRLHGHACIRRLAGYTGRVLRRMHRLAGCQLAGCSVAPPQLQPLLRPTNNHPRAARVPASAPSRSSRNRPPRLSPLRAYGSPLAFFQLRPSANYYAHADSVAPPRSTRPRPAAYRRACRPAPRAGGPRRCAPRRSGSCSGTHARQPGRVPAGLSRAIARLAGSRSQPAAAPSGLLVVPCTSALLGLPRLLRAPGPPLRLPCSGPRSQTPSQPAASPRARLPSSACYHALARRHPPPVADCGSGSLLPATARNR